MLKETAAKLEALKAAAHLDPNDPKDQLLAAVVDAIGALLEHESSQNEEIEAVEAVVTVLAEQSGLLDDEEDEMGEDEYFTDEEHMLYEVSCPRCSDSFAVDEASLLKGFNCPSCGEKLIQAEPEE